MESDLITMYLICGVPLDAVLHAPPRGPRRLTHLALEPFARERRLYGKRPSAAVSRTGVKQ